MTTCRALNLVFLFALLAAACGGDKDGKKTPDGAVDDADVTEDATVADASEDASVEPDAEVPPEVGACGAGLFEIGEYATSDAKVNVHRNWGGDWTVDEDCSSGNDNNTVDYCQKFWAPSTSQVAVTVEGDKPFTAGGGTAPTCGGLFTGTGSEQFACCVPNPCEDGSVPVGTYATYGGKVNVHRSLYGEWAVDDDCSSGNNINTVSYCQKFWPEADSQVELDAVDDAEKPFTAGGGTAPTCGGNYPSVGQVQFVCCAER
jgi:hypothetical protein